MTLYDVTMYDDLDVLAHSEHLTRDEVVSFVLRHVSRETKWRQVRITYADGQALSAVHSRQFHRTFRERL